MKTLKKLCAAKIKIFSYFCHLDKIFSSIKNINKNEKSFR